MSGPANARTGCGAVGEGWVASRRPDQPGCGAGAANRARPTGRRRRGWRGGARRTRGERRGRRRLGSRRQDLVAWKSAPWSANAAEPGPLLDGEPGSVAFDLGGAVAAQVRGEDQCARVGGLTEQFASGLAGLGGGPRRSSCSHPARPAAAPCAPGLRRTAHGRRPTGGPARTSRGCARVRGPAAGACRSGGSRPRAGSSRPGAPARRCRRRRSSEVFQPT